MAVPHKISLQFITDKDGRCRYVENGVIKISSPPIPLPQNAKGWKEATISFGTNQNYKSLNRSYSVPMFFIGDGAIICRDAIYRKKGYEEELYFISLRYNPQTGIYELEYKGRLDFGKYEDEPRKGVMVSTIEAGVMQYLANNDGVEYEIPLDITNPDCIQILFDGILLYDRLKFSTINIDLENFSGPLNNRTIPLPFISNEGDSVGVKFGGQSFDAFGDPAAYAASSANYLLCPTIRPLSVDVTGTISFRITKDNYGISGGVFVYFITTRQNQSPPTGSPGPLNLYYYSGIWSGPTDVTINVGQTIDLEPDEKLFLMVGFSGSATDHFTYHSLETNLFFAFNTRNDPSKAYALKPLDLWKELVSRATDGRFTGDSAHFATVDNVVMTSTSALRNLAYNYYTGPFETVDTAGVYTVVIPSTLANFPQGSQLIISGAASNNGGYTVLSTSLFVTGYTTITVLEPLTNASLEGSISTAAVIKQSIQNFFNDYDCDMPMGLKAVNDVLYIEPLEDIYAPTSEILDIGEITDFKIKYAYDMLCNTATFGSKTQDYRQRNGRYEFNTTTYFKLPVNTLKKDYTKITKSRRDSFGIEFVRALLFDKPTTDTTGDNQAFMVDVVPGADYVYYYGAFETMINTGQYYIKIPRILINLTNGNQLTISGAASNNGTYTIENTSYLTVGYTTIRVTEPLTNANLVGTISTSDATLYSVNRPAYDSITGVLNNTVFNTELTPHHQLLGHGRMLGSLLKQFPTEQILFKTADKNADLTLTYPGGRILSQKQSEIVSSLGDPLWLPFYGQFKTKVPLTFNQVYQAMATGYIKGTYIGVPIYFLPIGKMDAKPALNEPQVWEMILANTNDLNIINLLSSESDFTIDNMGNFLSTSFLNALHFVRYEYTLPPKYKHFDIDEARQHSRNEGYIQRPFYLQKWEKTDPGIPVQVITRGISAVSVDIYNADGTLYATYPMSITADAAVRTPMVRWDKLIDISGFPSGIYCAVISTAAGNLRMSEWFDVQDVHSKTLLFESSHTTNKFAHYFDDIIPIPFRVEATLLASFPDSTFTEYTDELADYEMIDGIPTMKQALRIGNAYGVPDWVSRKMNMYLLLNECYCEGQHISRTPDSKLAKKEVIGSPLYSYLVEITKAHPKYALSTDETGTNIDAVVAATLDAQGFGIANPGDLIEINLTLNP